MARSFLSSTFALATATVILLAVQAMSASAQAVDSSSASSTAAAKPQKYPEVEAAVQLVSGPTHDMAVC